MAGAGWRLDPVDRASFTLPVPLVGCDVTGPVGLDLMLRPLALPRLGGHLARRGAGDPVDAIATHIGGGETA